MKKAFFPGSFDPPTNGHLNMIRRAADIFDELHVLIAHNRDKKEFFEPRQRFDMMNELLKDFPNIQLHIWDRLIVDFANEFNIPLVIRGVRALADFSYEFELAMTNKSLKPDLEVIFMPTDPKYFVLRSSAIREIAHFGGDISSMVPPLVAEAVHQRLFPNA